MGSTYPKQFHGLKLLKRSAFTRVVLSSSLKILAIMPNIARPLFWGGWDIRMKITTLMDRHYTRSNDFSGRAWHIGPLLDDGSGYFLIADGHGNFSIVLRDNGEIATVRTMGADSCRSWVNSGGLPIIWDCPVRSL